MDPVFLGYDLTKDSALRAGFTQLNVFGHIDPLGVYSDYAASTGNTRFNTWDITQNILKSASIGPSRKEQLGPDRQVL